MQVYQFQVKWKDEAPDAESMWRNFAIGKYNEGVDRAFDEGIFFYVESAEEIIALTNPDNDEDFYVIGGITNE